MSSPQPKGPEISSGSIILPATDSAAKLHKPGIVCKKTDLFDGTHMFVDMSRRRETQQEDRKEEMCKTLASPNDEEMSHTARMMAKPEVKEEEKGKTRNVQQIKSRTVLPKQKPGTHELKMAMLKRENMTKDSKYDLIAIERQKALLELYLMTKRSEILKMDKAIGKEEARLKQLENILERENLRFEEFLRENEKKSLEARTFFEREAKSKQQKNAEIRKLTAEIVTIKSELAKFEEILIDYKRYEELLFKLSPPEWQEAQKTKASKAKVLSERAQSKQNMEPDRNGLDSKVSVPCGELPSIRETRLSSAHSDALSKTCKLESDSSEYEDEPELYFTDPQQLLDLVTELTEQNLSLFHISTRVEETLKELRQSMETTKKNIEKDEEPLKMQINDMNQRIDKEKARGAKLKQKVQLLGSLNTEDQDVMLEALDQKVAEVHRCCVDDRMTNLSTLEKLAKIEDRMSLVLQSLESIPEESLKMLKKIMDRERRSRQREEKLREQREKQEERMRRYSERSLTDSKKVSGKKLMTRSMPVAHKVRVSNVDTNPAEDDIHAYLYTSEDVE